MGKDPRDVEKRSDALLLGVESSCDESSLALWGESEGVFWQKTFSQIDLHAKYGGVVPDLASREHLAFFPRLLEDFPKEVAPSALKCIAVTTRPGLAGCLAMGIGLAKTLAWAWGCPVQGHHHLKAHAVSVFLEDAGSIPFSFRELVCPLLPHLGLIVSGGNTLLVLIDEAGRMMELGTTMDDAAGEALDKGGKLLGMPYPAGPHIEKTAAKAASSGNYDFPVAFAGQDTLKFSFSGLKTSLRYRVQKMTEGEVREQLPSLCRDYQDAVFEALLSRLEVALRQYNVKSIGLSGGVANNRTLQKRVRDLGQRWELPTKISPPAYSGDNAGMIAFRAAWCHFFGVPSEGVDLVPSQPIGSEINL